jgi:hypothetical protein
MDIQSIEAPAHLSDEAPAASELRNQAGKNLETIKAMVTEARQNGSLTKEDEEVLNEWLKQDVQAPAEHADTLDHERQTFLASHAVEKALVSDHKGVVETSWDATHPSEDVKAPVSSGRLVE